MEIFFTMDILHLTGSYMASEIFSKDTLHLEGIQLSSILLQSS